MNDHDVIYAMLAVINSEKTTGSTKKKAEALLNKVITKLDKKIK